MKKSNSGQKDKPLFFQRLVAFLIDVVIVSILSSLLATPFVNSKMTESLNDEAYGIIQKLRDENISTTQYVTDYMNVVYKLARANGLVSIITILLNIIMYVVIPLYYGGQTIGKKLLGIKIVADSTELNVNQLIYRSLIANSILLDLISVVLVITSSKSAYFYGLGMFTMIQYMVTLISIFMVMYSQDGRAVHDRLARTKVVKVA